MTTWFSVLDDNTIDLRADITYIKSLDAAKITVEHIMKNYPPPYNLMISGGVDSQAMLYAWKLFGKDYIPTSVLFNQSLNAHDLPAQSPFIQQQQIDVTYINFDLIEFYNTKYPDICNRYRCISPHFGAHLGMIENLPGTSIFSGDRLGLHSAAIKKNNLCLWEASKTKNIIPYFFMHTPELAYSAIYEHYNLLLPKHPTIEERYRAKCQIWMKSGFPVVPQIIKYTGFEKIKDYYDVHYSHLVTSLTKVRYASSASKRTYDLLLRYPYENKFGNPEFKYLLNDIVAINTNQESLNVGCIKKEISRESRSSNRSHQVVGRQKKRAVRYL